MNLNNQIQIINLKDILPNRFQPRRQFNEKDLVELTKSIKEHGIINPIVVRPIGNKFEIIAGERRCKASFLAGKETIPAIVKNLDDKQSAEIALIENIQRKDLSPIEEANSYKKILDMGSFTQEQLADKLGKSQSTIANKMRLLNLDESVQQALLNNKISERHARSLLKLKDLSVQKKMLNRIINERLTVRRTDEEIKKEIKKEGEKNMNDSTTEKNLDYLIDQANNLSNNNDQYNISKIPTTPIENSEIKPVEITNLSNNGFIDKSQIEEQNDFSFNSQSFDTMQSELPESNQFRSDINNMNQQSEINPQTGILNMNSESENLNVNPESTQFTSVLDNMNQQPEINPQTGIPNMNSESENLNVNPESNQFTSVLNNMNQQPEINPQIGIPNANSESTQFSNISNNVQQSEQIDTVNPDSSRLYSFNFLNPNKMESPNINNNLKMVIDEVRNLKNKIEQMGFQVELDEYNLDNIYQFNLKINKD